MVKKEVEMFDVRRAEEFKAGVVTYLEAMLRSQVCTIGQRERQSQSDHNDFWNFNND